MTWLERKRDFRLILFTVITRENLHSHKKINTFIKDNSTVESWVLEWNVTSRLENLGGILVEKILQAERAMKESHLEWWLRRWGRSGWRCFGRIFEVDPDDDGSSWREGGNKKRGKIMLECKCVYTVLRRYMVSSDEVTQQIPRVHGCSFLHEWQTMIGIDCTNQGETSPVSCWPIHSHV